MKEVNNIGTHMIDTGGSVPVCVPCQPNGEHQLVDQTIDHMDLGPQHPPRPPDGQGHVTNDTPKITHPQNLRQENLLMLKNRVNQEMKTLMLTWLWRPRVSDLFSSSRLVVFFPTFI